VDLKTSAKKITLEDVDRDQLGLYAIAARKTGLLGQFNLPLTLGVLAVTKTKVSEVISLGIKPDQDSENRVIAKARAIWRAMSSGICYPAPGWQCGNCGYARLCAKWPEAP
jgi:CRISPR/Cas system-associated exonuclease Cas4 (RecB family)